MRYVVTVQRTEQIEYEVEADSPESAAERFLLEGDEVASATIDGPTVLSVGSAQP